MPEGRLDWDAVSRVDGWLTRSEGELLYALSGRIPQGAIVEIGSWMGKSTICLAMGARAETKVYAIDPHVGSTKNQTAAGGCIWTFEQFKENLARFGILDRVVPIVDFSGNVGRTWDKPIGLLFIDGAHDLSSVEMDFDLFWPHVVPGGWVLMHDTTWARHLSGWRGPRLIAHRNLYGSQTVGSLRLVDTTTAGQRVVSISRLCRLQKTLLRVRKLPSDGVSIALTAAFRLLPLKRTIRRIFGKSSA